MLPAGARAGQGAPPFRRKRRVAQGHEASGARVATGRPLLLSPRHSHAHTRFGPVNDPRTNGRRSHERLHEKKKLQSNRTVAGTDWSPPGAAVGRSRLKAWGFWIRGQPPVAAPCRRGKGRGVRGAVQQTVSTQKKKRVCGPGANCGSGRPSGRLGRARGAEIDRGGAAPVSSGTMAPGPARKETKVDTMIPASWSKRGTPLPVTSCFVPPLP